VKHAAILLIALFATSCATEHMMTAEYKYPQTFPEIGESHVYQGTFVQMSAYDDAPLDANVMRKFLESAGVTFPRGASLSIDTNKRVIILTNSRENHERFKRINTPLNSD
jgi:hypothetical protein